MKKLDTKIMSRIHETLGDAYLDEMKRLGIEFPPPVAWMTHPPVPDGRTVAVIFFDDHEEEVSGFPRDMLAAAVVLRAMSGVVMPERN